MKWYKLSSKDLQKVSNIIRLLLEIVSSVVFANCHDRAATFARHCFFERLLPDIPVIVKGIKEHKNAEKVLDAAIHKHAKLLKASTKRTEKNNGYVYIHCPEYAHANSAVCKKFALPLECGRLALQLMRCCHLANALLAGKRRVKLFLPRKFLPTRMKTPK